MKKQKLPIAEKPQTAESIDFEKITAAILKKIKAEKIICFGSIINQKLIKNCFTAKEENIDCQAQNSYCLLIVPVLQESMPDILIQQRLEEELKHIANVVIIVHRTEEINQALEHGSTFFASVYKEGKMLYDRGEELFSGLFLDTSSIPKRIIRREQFWRKWFQLSSDFLAGARFYASNQTSSLAVFMAHQALQHCYSGILRIYTGFRSNTNGLRRLMKLIEIVVPDYAFSSAKQSPEFARLTVLLLKGYGDARYNDKFEATEEEVAKILDRVADILNIANSACMARIKDIKDGTLSYQG